jgi:hypothetical protein
MLVPQKFRKTATGGTVLCHDSDVLDDRLGRDDVTDDFELLENEGHGDVVTW